MPQSKWASRFLTAGIIQGAVAFVVMSVLLYLAVFGTPAASRIVAGGGAGNWLIVGIIGYALVGVLGIAVSGLFYQHLEVTLASPYSGWRNFAAWGHLVLGGACGSAAALFMAWGGYRAGAYLLSTAIGGGCAPGDTGCFAYVHVNILEPLILPIAGLMGLSLLGFFLGGVGYVTAWMAAVKEAKGA
jgi:hypothetical protein